MKRNNLFLVTLFGLFSGIFAAQNSGNLSLTIRLYPIQTISVNTTSGDVGLDYKTKDDYKNGVNITQEDHLRINSIGGFTIHVKSSSSKLTNTHNAGLSIDAGDIYISASKGTTNGMDGFSSNAVTLSTTNQQLIKSTVGGTNKTFNINYTAKGDADQYMEKKIGNQNPTVYSTEVIYTIEPS